MVSPIINVEPLLVSLIVQLRRMCTPISCATGLALANLLIQGTETEEKVIKWKKKYSYISDTMSDDDSTLSRGYWNGFMRRNKREIESK